MTELGDIHVKGYLDSESTQIEYAKKACRDLGGNLIKVNSYYSNS